MDPQIINLTIPLFEKRYPGHQAVFFDNATNHAAYAEDALRAKGMNLGPGGKQPCLRSGVNPRTGSCQEMQNAKGIPNGMRTIQEERGLWRQDLRTQCKIVNPKEESKTKRINNPECLRPIDGRQCCARAILSSPPAF